MQKTTISLIQELEQLHRVENRRFIIENQANNIITSAINLIDRIGNEYGKEAQEVFERKLCIAIKSRNPAKFAKMIKKTDSNAASTVETKSPTTPL